jgi:hypothetical protein
MSQALQQPPSHDGLSPPCYSWDTTVKLLRKHYRRHVEGILVRHGKIVRL